MTKSNDAFYQRLFRASPGKILVLAPEDFEIIAVTDEYLKATMTRPGDLIGKTLFEVFPDNPDDSSTDGVKSLSASLQKVLSMKTADIMGVQRYPIRLPSGEFQERFWSPVNSPVMDSSGAVEYIMHRVEDVTKIIQEDNTDSLTEPGNRLALQDIVVRSKELRQTLSKLQEHEVRMKTAERLLSLGTWEYNPRTGDLNWSRQVFDIYDVPHWFSAPDIEKYFTMVHPDDQDAARAIYQSFSDDHLDQILFGHRVIARDGSIRHIKGVGERHITPEGEVVVGYVQDITSLVTTQDRLTQAEQLVRLAGEKAKLGGWRVELDSMSVFWTPETANIHGMPEDYSPEHVNKAIQFYAPDFRPIVEAAFEQCVQYGKAFDITCQLQRPDGRHPWVRVIGEAQYNDQNKVTAVQGAFQDISILRDAQLRADEAEERQLNILESISDAFFALNHQWHFTYLNQQAGVLLNRLTEQLLGKNVWAEFPESKGTLVEQQYQRVLEHQETVRFREFFPPLNKWFDISAYPIPDGLAVYFRDVTREHEHQERFNLISKATNDVIWDWNFSTDQIWWNESVTELFGYSVSELESGPESWTSRIHPDDLDQVVNRIHDVIDGDQEYWSDEYRFIKQDGQIANVIDRGFVIRDANGKAIRMVGSMLDITERMELAEKLRESQKLEAVGHLTGGVAHDFNNLLTVILGNAEMMAELATDPEQKLMAEMTVSAATRGAELTSRLLAFARRQPLDPKPTDINQLVESMRELVRRTLPENIQLEFSSAADLGVAELDANELDTALLNLIVNARDAMPGGGKLTIETANAMLDQHYAERHAEVTPGEYIMICVSDTGVGMSPEVARRVFEPFFTTKSLGKGSGLGLSMVFGFTKQSGGHINIYSEPNEGTSVKLYFPRVRGMQQTRYQPASDSSPQGGKEHILIAEDDSLVLQHLERQLRSLGYQVTAVSSGPDALQALATNNNIDLLLTDIVMPGGMNGRELADSVVKTHPSLKVLFTSGYSENAIIHHGRLDQGVELLSKPYTRLELATKVRQVLDAEASHQ
ncbi:PAS domain S-box-containing protein [Pseudidiomarina planktonica]|uniref:histidine kinase n=1 Tax=Pseudidiomarina planktonica TaxID=1323738 RepID=A0A1Y6E7J4_9GAMM|nr:PAS domain-containing protein [Pseudidiomarina planktonica]RUO66352.1 hybrid sensor histidine kinase/response regulator [Pseudidiomarina planktonica]SMQ58624.1 PAS domain S-box-containing protein [Pseudidiomarina planktonica]